MPLKETNQTVDRQHENFLATIGQMASGIAHEVRNPLTAVKGFIQLLKEKEAHPYLMLAEEELENAINTLTNLLQVSKPDIDSEPFVTINLCSELEAILYLFQEHFYRIQIEKKFKDRSALILGKKNLLKKALFNLIKNAIEAIPEQEEGKITIEHYVSGHHVHIVIRDTGVGIPEDKMNLIGSPFFSTKSYGTGMGLTQVFSTFHHHKGEIKVQSNVGKGTAFFITLPIKENMEHMTEALKNKLQYIDGQSFREFVLHNQDEFNHLLLKNFDIVDQIEGASKLVDKNRMADTAKQLVSCIEQKKEHDLIILAKQRGTDWAKSNLPVHLMLDYFKNFREAYWYFMGVYFQHNSPSTEEVFQSAKDMNGLLDQTIHHYVSSYTEYRNTVLDAHRETINELTTPTIPLTDGIAILPLIGLIDTKRAQIIQEATFKKIHTLDLNLIIVDLSGVSFLDTAVLSHLFRLVEGMKVMGCEAIITGISPEIAQALVRLGVDLSEKASTKGTLQKALRELEIFK